MGLVAALNWVVSCVLLRPAGIRRIDIDVRSYPESRHSDGSRETSAHDPKRTLKNSLEKPSYFVGFSLACFARITLPRTSILAALLSCTVFRRRAAYYSKLMAIWSRSGCCTGISRPFTIPYGCYFTFQMTEVAVP